MILAGDIGGTQTRLALFGGKEDAEILLEERLVSKNHESLIDALKWFLKGQSRNIDAACFGVAGPVIRGQCQLSNLKWMIDSGEVSRRLEIPSVSLINDLEATAFGISALKEEDFFTLNTGRIEPCGNKVVIAAGTGLGEAILFWDGTRHRPCSTEGGHCDFAPRNATEINLLTFLLKRYPRVSYERVLSGLGLLNIYEFFEESVQSKKTGRVIDLSQTSECVQKADSASVISELALRGKSKTSVKSLDLFVSLYGAEAGNLALKTLARGGVYIGGGIAPKILKKLQDGTFMKAFLAKGRFASLMEAMPVKVILNDLTGLLGASYYLRQHRQQTLE